MQHQKLTKQNQCKQEQKNIFFACQKTQNSQQNIKILMEGSQEVGKFEQTVCKIQPKKKIQCASPILQMGQKYYVDMTRQLGHGFASIVYLGCKIQKNQPICVKIIDFLSFSNQKQLKMLTEEIRYLKQFQHDNIVKIYDVFESSSFCYLMMELCPGGDLYKHLMGRKAPMLQLEVKTFIKGICNGLQEIKNKQMIHRDLKTENIFLGKNGTIKIGDLGFCTSAQNPDKMNVGSPIYMSPEVASQQKYSYSSDIYGLGIIWYELYHKHAPWQAINEKQLFKRKQQEVPIFKREDISKQERQMILKCLQLQPEKRCTLQQILDYLK